MAEVLFLQRGNYRAVDDFERFLDGQLFMFERDYFKKDKVTGEKKAEKAKFFLQGGRREYKIVGYAIPDDKVNEFLNGLEIGDGKVTPKQASIAVNILRKAMGAEKIPPAKERGTTSRVIPRTGVAIYPIGIKRDEKSIWTDNSTGEEFEQENI